jgi:hypothetical protein
VTSGSDAFGLGVFEPTARKEEPKREPPPLPREEARPVRSQEPARAEPEDTSFGAGI